MERQSGEVEIICERLHSATEPWQRRDGERILHVGETENNRYRYKEDEESKMIPMEPIHLRPGRRCVQRPRLQVWEAEKLVRAGRRGVREGIPNRIGGGWSNRMRRVQFQGPLR
jgi:hypothetical protein